MDQIIFCIQKRYDDYFQLHSQNIKLYKQQETFRQVKENRLFDQIKKYKTEDFHLKYIMEKCYQPMKQICPGYSCNKNIYDVNQLTENFLIFFQLLGQKNQNDHIQQFVQKTSSNQVITYLRWLVDVQRNYFQNRITQLSQDCFSHEQDLFSKIRNIQFQRTQRFQMPIINKNQIKKLNTFKRDQIKFDCDFSKDIVNTQSSFKIEDHFPCVPQTIQTERQPLLYQKNSNQTLTQNMQNIIEKFENVQDASQNKIPILFNKMINFQQDQKYQYIFKKYSVPVKYSKLSQVYNKKNQKTQQKENQYFEFDLIKSQEFKTAASLNLEKKEINTTEDKPLETQENDKLNTSNEPILETLIQEYKEKKQKQNKVQVLKKLDTTLMLKTQPKFTYKNNYNYYLKLLKRVISDLDVSDIMIQKSIVSKFFKNITELTLYKTIYQLNSEIKNTLQEYKNNYKQNIVHNYKQSDHIYFLNLQKNNNLNSSLLKQKREIDKLNKSCDFQQKLSKNFIKYCQFYKEKD